MNTNVNVKVITEVNLKTGGFSISCFSDMNEDDTTYPNIYKSQVLEVPKVIDNTRGSEGELMLSEGDDDYGTINDNGELVITVESDDDVNKYEKEDENLIYNG